MRALLEFAQALQSNVPQVNFYPTTYIEPILASQCRKNYALGDGLVLS